LDLLKSRQSDDKIKPEIKKTGKRRREKNETPKKPDLKRPKISEEKVIKKLN